MSRQVPRTKIQDEMTEGWCKHMFRKHGSILGITKACGRHYSTVRRAFRRHALPIEPRLIHHEPRHLLAVTDKCSCWRQAETAFRCGQKEIQRAFESHGMPVPFRKGFAHPFHNISTEALHNAYIDAGYSIPGVAEAFGVCRSTVLRAMKSRGLKRTLGKTSIPFRREELADMYGRGYGAVRIARYYGCSAAAVAKAFKRFGIHTRPQRLGHAALVFTKVCGRDARGGWTKAPPIAPTMANMGSDADWESTPDTTRR